MQVGVMNHPARDPVQEIDWIGQNGFDFVDFTLEPPAADPEEIDVDAIRATLDRHNLGVVAHTAYYLPLASPFASIRQACLVEFRKALKAAHRINVPSVDPQKINLTKLTLAVGLHGQMVM